MGLVEEYLGGTEEVERMFWSYGNGLIRLIQADPPRLMPDLSQREPGVENPPNNAMNAAWRRGNESSKQRIDERYASNLS